MHSMKAFLLDCLSKKKYKPMHLSFLQASLHFQKYQGF